MSRQTKICILSKYLISKGVCSPLKLQKLLFFLRYEEVLSGNLKESYFNKSDNFQAWIYGPVNYESYVFCQNYFWGQDEKENYLLLEDEIKNIDKIYGKFFQKWNAISASELVDKSHKNISWIEARGDLSNDTPCNKILNESIDKFTKFIE